MLPTQTCYPRKLMRRVRVVHRAGVATLTLAHPAKRNALSTRMMLELTSALHEHAHGARAVVLRAEGSCFSAGHDLAEITTAASLPDAEARAALSNIFETCGELMRAIREAPVPVIACVEYAKASLKPPARRAA